MEDLKTLPKILIPRYFGVNKNVEVQLHTFCDASELALAAVSYVRIKHDDDISFNFVMCKSRVAPLKKITLPRLELQGAVLAIWLKDTIIKVMDTPFNSIHFWTDSTLNLQ